jgi:hypothetical protein
MGEHKRIRLETDRAFYSVSGQVQIYAHLLDDRFEPIRQSGFGVTVSPLDIPGAQKQELTLRPDAGNPGLYEGYFSPTLSGRYRVEANATDRSLASTTEFQVADVEPEMDDTAMQIEQLRRIAELSGGKCLSMLGISELQSLLNLEPYTTTFTTQVPLWDTGWLVLLLVLLMGMEWFVRRRYDLP